MWFRHATSIVGARHRAVEGDALALRSGLRVVGRLRWLVRLRRASEGEDVRRVDRFSFEMTLSWVTASSPRVSVPLRAGLFYL